MPQSDALAPVPSNGVTPMNEDPTDGYGEPSANARTTGGTVDFFSTLGTERKKPPRPDRPDPEKVSILRTYFLAVYMIQIASTSIASCHLPQRA